MCNGKTERVAHLMNLLKNTNVFCSLRYYRIVEFFDPKIQKRILIVRKMVETAFLSIRNALQQITQKKSDIFEVIISKRECEIVESLFVLLFMDGSYKKNVKNIEIHKIY